MLNELVRKKIEPLLLRLGFKLVTEGDGSLVYSSSALVVKFIFEKREHSLNFFLGNSDENLVLFDNDILLGAFGSEKKIDQVPIEQFVNNLVSFFEDEGFSLLSGDRDELQRLLIYQEERSEIYTARIREKQLRSLTDY